VDGGGDRLTVLCAPEQAEQARACLAGGTVEATAPRYLTLAVQPDAPAAGRAVAALGLPHEALIVALRRDGRTHTVHGDTVLQPGDELTVLAPSEELAAVRERLVGQPLDGEE
jgi:NhaP-type Na+/H+ and K+/H+ antiporter